MKLFPLIFILLWANLVFGQVKIGANINTIDGASLVELESDTRVFVVTRVSTTQMNAITPLNGAIVYNTDTNCIYYYNGINWLNLCDTSNTGGMLSDNLDGTFTFADSNGVQTIFRADDDITAVTFDGTDLTVDEGLTTSFSANLSALEESADITAEETRALAAEGVIQTDVDNNEVAANAALAIKEDAANKSTDGTLVDNSDVDFPTEQAVKTYVDTQVGTITTDDDITSATLSAASLLTINEGTSSVDVSLADLEESADIANLQADVDANEADADAGIATNATDIASNAMAIAAHNTADGDLSSTNELSDIELSGTTVNLTNPEVGATGVNLDMTFATDTELAAVADDDITAVTFDGTDLTVDEGASTSFSANLSALEESADIVALQADVDLNEADADAAITANATAITIHNTADEDLSNTNELSDIAILGTTLNLTNPEAGAIGVDLDATFATDAELIIATDDDITNVSFDGTNLTVDEGISTSFSANLSSLEESADITAEQTRALTVEAAIQADVNTNEADADAAIAANTSAIAAHNTADGDLNDTNELSDVALTGTTINLTNPEAGAIGVDLDAIFATDAELDSFEVTDVLAGHLIATIAEPDGTAVEIDETITGLASPTGAESTLVYTDEGSGTTTIPNITRSVNGVNPAANGNVAVILSSVSTGLETDLPAAGIDADIYIVSGEVAPNADRNGVAFIYDDPLGWQEITTDLAATDSRYVNLIGDAMTGPLAMGNNSITGVNDPVNLQDAATKAYVDTQIGASADDDITGVSFDGTNLQVIEGTSNFSANLSALEESADIILLQADVDTNEADADAAIALKEDLTNKSSDIALGTSDILFPTQNAVKTYVDGQISASSDDDISGVSFDGTNLQVDEGTTNFSANLSALEESADITAEQTRAFTAEAALQADVDANEADADTAIAANTSAITAHDLADEDLSNTNEIQTLSISGNDLSISGTGGNMITLPTLSGTTGSVFFANTDGTPTQNNTQLFWDNTNNRLGIGTNSPSHKLQVSGQVRATSFANANGTANAPSYRFNSDSNTGMYRANTDQLGFSTSGTEALRIDNSQNVGIGDFSSGTVDASLHVKSDDVPLKIEPSTTTPAGSSGGQMFVSGDNGLLYIYDGTRSKWLSIDRTSVGWGRNSGNATNEYLRQFNGALSNQNGWRMIRDGTITAITAQSNINQTWTLEIRKNDTNTVIASITMTNTQGNHSNTMNIDFNEGDYIQAYCNGNSVDYPQTLIEIAWRK